MSTRLRRTRALVRAEDRAARTIISLGGVGVVVAVLGICLYLLVTVLPLFEGGSARPGAAPVAAGGETPVAIVLDDDGRAVTLMAPDGSLRTLMIDDGSEVATARMGAEAPPALLTGPGVDGSLVGVEHDGSFWFGTLGFSSTLLEAGTVARPGVVGATFRAGAAALDREAARGGFVVRTSTGESRLTVPIHARTAPIRLDGAPAHPRLVAASRARSGERFVVLLGDDGRGVLGLSRTVTPMGQPAREQWTSVPLWLGDGGEHEHAESGGDPLRPDWLFITSDGAAILALWRGGLCVRLGVVDGVVVEAERRRLVDQGRTVTSALMLLGGLTLVVGDDAGIAHGYFTARDPRAGTVDALRLVEAHRFRVAEGAVVAMATASRDRLVLAADDRGHATLVHMTSHKRVARLDSRVGAAVSAAVAPRGDAVMLVGAEGRIDHWRITLGHPKASWHALFGRPLYEGQTEGSYVYQSSAGSDQAELKMSLVPLLFGTLKATVFATLFAIPLAVLAAIYTSEFLSPRTRRVIKPVIELMASLPSVVLGFVASMVVAPLLAAWLPGVLACLVAVPVSVLLGAHLWQLVPARVAVRMRGGWQVLLVAACAGLGVAVGLGGASSLESMLFVPSRADTLVRAGSFEQVPEAQWPDWVGMRRAVSPAESRMLRAEGLAFRAGRVVRPVEPAPERLDAVRDVIARNGLDRADLRAWLDGTIGSAFPGWAVVLFPPAMIVAWLVGHAATRARFARIAGAGSLAAADALRFVGILAGAVAIDLGAAALLSGVGLDPRDSILGPFSVRNSMVVGIIMGFAIIPIIYTISEDAMRGVPQGLRLASLGSGATPWQTAVRVVLPVAASGIFSASMIGLGRAVGETMIVIMATGNSPEMNWNIFSGFRTLAANIAVELPESDKGSTHYRLLFLCGLLLFAITFVINTTAEVVRQHFRRRNAAL